MSIFKKVKPGHLSAAMVVPKHTVMLVDDEPDNLEILEAILSEKYNVMVASDGVDAMNQIMAMGNKENLSLVVSDQRMPHMTGVQLCEKLCTVLPNTMRIIVTGYIDIDAIVDSVNRANIYKFVIKPFDRHDFELTVQRAIEAYEARQKHDQHVQNLVRELDQRKAEVQELKQEVAQLRAQLQQSPAA